MKILITGGSGHMGRALMKFAPEHEYTVYSRDERKQELCRIRGYKANYILGDICDRDRLVEALRGHDAIIHLAAVKYIPEAEYNVSECIKINVEGSRNVLWAARQRGVTVVGVSTDKACSPVNVYGATKMLMERLFGEAAHDGLRCNTVRYGNVVGSTGSVIPLFKRQMQEQGFVTLTDPDMSRYWMSAKEAVDVVLSPLEDRLFSGSTLIYEPQSMKMGEVALHIAQSWDNIKVTGIRPGERRYEAILNEFEATRAYRHMATGKRIKDYYEVLSMRVWDGVSKSEPFELRSDSVSELTSTQLDEMISQSEELYV